MNRRVDEFVFAAILLDRLKLPRFRTERSGKWIGLEKKGNKVKVF